MFALSWGLPGTKQFEAGLDRGVLYPTPSTAVVWNGLTSVSDESDAAVESYFLDGVNYLNRRTPTNFKGTLKAITYPDEFQQFDGLDQYDSGIYVAHQPVPGTFGLSYRTGLGDDVNGVSGGYKLHVLYNLTATLDTRTYNSIGSTATPQEFSWNLFGVPASVMNMRPSCHFIINSTEVNPGTMALVENALYGTDTTNAYLPDAQTLVQMQQMAS